MAISPIFKAQINKAENKIPTGLPSPNNATAIPSDPIEWHY